MATQIFEADDPKVLDGTYDVYGYTPKDRRAQVKRMQAAAPDLYAALALYVEHFGDPLKVARPALAKAEGR